jgi:S1-C subfamily serine protease
VIDLSGRLVGVSSAKMAFTPQGVPTQGLGFAIPAEVVRDSVNRFKKIAQKQPNQRNQSTSALDMSVSNAEKLFGMQLQDLNQELSDALGYIRGRGVLITAVEPDSPADEAGLERGLLIYRLGNSETNSVKRIEELLRGVPSGTKLEFTVGVIRTGRQTRQLATLSMTAR